MAIASFIIGMMLGGAWAIYASIVWVPAIAIAFIRRRTADHLSGHQSPSIWVWRSLTGQRKYRARVPARRPAGTLALPGDAASLRQYTDPVTGAVHGP